MLALDLVLHDWRNLLPEERKVALEDIRALANAYKHHEERRARALNIVASFMHFLTEASPGDRAS